MPIQIDPNGGQVALQPSFEEQMAQILRQRKIAEMLRKQAQAAQPEGQMVSGHYVRPNAMQSLVPLLNQYNAGAQERKVGSQEDEFNRQANAARDKWSSQLPQAVAAQKELQGPPDPNTGSPELAAQPALPVTMQQIMAHTAKGLPIPGNKEAAELYNKGAMSELEREDKQAAKREEAEAKVDAVRERDLFAAGEKLKQIKLQQANKLTPEQQVMLKKMEDTTKRYIADKSAAARLGAAEKAAAAKGANVKPVPHNVTKDLDDAQDIATSLMDSQVTFKPEYGGLGGMAQAIGGKWIPGMNEEAANWWSQYEGSGLKARHDLFGATLTGPEAASWKAATIEKGMNPGVIARNLQLRSYIAAKHYNDLRKRKVATGYPQIQDAYEELPEMAEPLEGGQSIPMSPPPQQQVPRSLGAPQQPGIPPQTTQPPQAPQGRPLPPGFRRG